MKNIFAVRLWRMSLALALIGVLAGGSCEVSDLPELELEGAKVQLLEYWNNAKNQLGDYFEDGKAKLSDYLDRLKNYDKVDGALPSRTEVRSHYRSSVEMSFRVRGNIVEITVNQPLHQVSRGGRLWAKVGPYIYLFTEETESLLKSYPGVSGVRVITQTSRRKNEVARAFLRRNALNALTWKRAKNISGKARRDGTQRPASLEDLVKWGEDHTEFQYRSEFSGR